jgi:hypothetical protein
MKHIIHLVIIFLVWMFPHIASGQINDADKHFVVLAGQEKTDFISARYEPTAVQSLVENCFVKVTPGSSPYKITISPKQGSHNFVGKAKAVFQYIDGFPPKPRYITYHIDFVPSVITTSPDFVNFNSNEEILIDPLVNDNTTSAELNVGGISLVQSGTARVSENKIYFTPSEGEDNAFVLYSVKDDKGTTANGVVYLMRQQSVAELNDTIRVSLLNTQSTFITLPFAGFVPSSSTNLGQLEVKHAQVFRYIPNKGSSGQDIFTLQNGNYKRVVVVTIINRVQNTSSVKDDRVFTPKNSPVTFDVFDNDLSSNFPISAYSTGLIKGNKGVFTYTPPVGFSGVKNFTYTVNYGTYQAQGKITITVGNFEPVQSVNYSFNTLKNAPVAITYDVPLNNYSFKVLNHPEYGTAEIFDINTSITDECNTIKSKASLIYTPYNNYYGADSFDIEYCVPNNPCIVYKIYIRVHDHNLSVCPCTGRDCVWSGDLNGDGRVSISDILPLGRFIGLNGKARSDINLPYRGGQKSDDWAYQQPNGLNIKHIDADGDGLLSVLDTAAISENFGLVHNFVPSEVFAVKDYGFQLVPNTTELDSGDLLVLDVILGSPSKPVVDLMGLVYSLNFAPHIFAPGTIYAEFFKDSWLTKGNASIQMSKNNSLGVLQAGIVKAGAVVTDEADGFKPTGGTGNGLIGKVYAVVTDEADGFRPSPGSNKTQTYLYRSVNTDGIEIEDIDGEKFMIPDVYAEFRVNTEKKIPVPSEDKLIIYPNPVQDALNIHFNGRNIIKGYKMYDAMGAVVAGIEQLNQQAVTINTSQLSAGVYIMQVVTTEGTITKKITVSPKE